MHVHKYDAHIYMDDLLLATETWEDQLLLLTDVLLERGLERQD